MSRLWSACNHKHVWPDYDQPGIRLYLLWQSMISLFLYGRSTRVAIQVYGWQTFHTMTIEKKTGNWWHYHKLFFVWQFMVHSMICMSGQPGCVLGIAIRPHCLSQSLLQTFLGHMCRKLEDLFAKFFDFSGNVLLIPLDQQYASQRSLGWFSGPL